MKQKHKYKLSEKDHINIIAAMQKEMRDLTKNLQVTEADIHELLLKLPSGKKRGLIKRVAQQLDLDYSLLYNYIRYTWSKKFYNSIECCNNLISQFILKNYNDLVLQQIDLKKVKQQIWINLQNEFKPFNLHPETLYNAFNYRFAQLSNSHPLNAQILPEKEQNEEDRQEELNYNEKEEIDYKTSQKLGSYGQSYQGGRIDAIYTYIQQHTNFVDFDGEIIELQVL